MDFVHQSPQTYRMSRIPMRISGSDHTGSNQNHKLFSDSEHEARLMKNQLSPLQRLQLEYQEKLQLEKEKKITHLYEKWNDQALKKVGKYSGKRNHKVHANGTSSTNKLSGHQNGSSEVVSERMANSAQQRMRIRKPQKLPPIDSMKKASSFHSPDPMQNSSYNDPKEFSSSRYGHKDVSMEHSRAFVLNRESNSVDDDGHSSPPPNVQHLRILRERRLKHRKAVHPEEERKIKDGYEYQPHQPKRKLTDFENWQLEQDKQRITRLQRHYKEQNEKNIITDPQPAALDSTSPQVFGRKSKKSDNRTFVSGMITSKRSSSPIRKNDLAELKRNEVLRVGIANEKKIAELEKEIERKQMDLKKLQENEHISILGGIGDMTLSIDDSDHESQVFSNHTLLSKPTKVMSKKLQHSYETNILPEEEEVVGFQMKPVIVRRDGSQGSSRGNPTPQKDKTYLVSSNKTKRKAPRNNTFMTSDFKPREGKAHIKPSSQPSRGVDLIQSSAYPVGDIHMEEQNVALNLVPCNICGRKFAEDRLGKHTKVCSKNQGKKRKVFDMTKARTQGTDAEKFVARKALKRSPSPPTKKSDWRRKHNEFISTIRNAKQVSEHIAKGGKASDLPPPPPSENPDYIKCEYCGRRFNPTVAQRHIPKCKDIKSRPKPLKRK